MVSCSVMVGSAVDGVMVCTPEPGMLKLMVSAPESPAIHSPPVAPDDVLLFDDVMASLRVHTPSSAVVSLVEFTVRVAAWALGERDSSSTRLASRVSRNIKLVFVIPLSIVVMVKVIISEYGIEDKDLLGCVMLVRFEIWH